MISPHVSFTEATKSNAAIRHGIDNTPNAEQLKSMRYVAVEVFEKVREHFGKAIDVNSFFRHPDVNAVIGGSKSSQHCLGEAMDIDGDRTGVDNAEIFEFIKANILFDQLIWEFGDEEKPAWVHVSRKEEGNRRQVLMAYRDSSGSTKYKQM